MLGIFRKAPDLSASARQLGAAGAKARIDRDRELRREMTNKIRADLRGKGHDLPAIDWSQFK